MLVDDADYLLESVARGHSQQAAELADAIVDVDYEVARLHFLQFFHREGHLAASGSVAPQAVLVEAVEYLVVGEAADAQLVVGESLVDGLLHGSELHGPLRPLAVLQSHLGPAVVHSVEDVAQPFLLPLAVGEDIDVVALE